MPNIEYRISLTCQTLDIQKFISCQEHTLYRWSFFSNPKNVHESNYCTNRKFRIYWLAIEDQDEWEFMVYDEMIIFEIWKFFYRSHWDNIEIIDRFEVFNPLWIFRVDRGI